MKKITNTQKILKALRSGPKTQADLIRETKVKSVYQVVADLVKKGLVSKVNGVVTLDREKKTVPITPDEASKLKAKHTSQFVYETTKARIEKANHDRVEFSGPRSHICVSMLTDEIENINAGIRALTITKSYLQRRIEEERSRA